MGVYKYDPTNQVLEPVAASSTDFGGATSSTNGTHGLVPAPTSADVQKFLSAKGTWEYAGNIFYGTRTEWNQLTAAQKAIFSSDNMGIVCLYNDGIFEYDVTNDTLIVLSSRGHVIKNESGTAFTERTNLQIKNGYVSDDSTNDATIIESDNFVGTQAEWNALSAAEQAKYKSKDIVDDTVYDSEDKSQLTTQNKSSLVGAINEVNSKTIVNQNDVYGYINSNNVFVPFKSQADIDAAVSAAMIGNATAADVRKGKTFTNSSNSGLVGTLVTERFQGGSLKTTKNIDGWSDIWTKKTWSGLTAFSGGYVWTDGDNFYYSEYSTQKILNKSTSTWSDKTWSGLTDFGRYDIWTDGTNIYYSSDSTQKILNKSTSTWSDKTWSGLTSFYGSNIWTDGTNIYYSGGSTQKILNKSTSTWSDKTWSGLTSFYGYSIWTDGDNIYYPNGSSHFVLNKSNSTWSNKTWSGLTSFNGYSIWTDGTNIYYSNGTIQKILNKSTSTWSDKTWSGLTNFSGNHVWTDSDNIYYSNGSSKQYVLNKSKTHWVV